jgi:hypothetical protein
MQNQDHMMNTMRFIDDAAANNLVYHYNGGQAYIRLFAQSQWLMVIDHTSTLSGPVITIHDGTAYFETYEGNQFEYSRRIRENSLADWMHHVQVASNQ